MTPATRIPSDRMMLAAPRARRATKSSVKVRKIHSALASCGRNVHEIHQKLDTWRAILAVVCLAASMSAPAPAQARTRRPLFEPTDLEMEDPGISEIDLQVGEIRGSSGPFRLVIPDFEVDLGLLENLELDVDGAYAIEGGSSGSFSLDHAAPDSLWPSLKVGIIDHPAQEGEGRVGFAVGVQIGPKLPVAAGSHGLGAESLLLVGLICCHGAHAALNLGGFADPAPDPLSTRPKGVEVGLDLDVDLGASGRFHATGEVSMVRFISADPPQLLATSGLAWSVSPSVDLSLTGLVGI